MLDSLMNGFFMKFEMRSGLSPKAAIFDVAIKSFFSFFICHYGAWEVLYGSNIGRVCIWTFNLLKKFIGWLLHKKKLLKISNYVTSSSAQLAYTSSASVPSVSLYCSSVSSTDLPRLLRFSDKPLYTNSLTNFHGKKCSRNGPFPDGLQYMNIEYTGNTRDLCPNRGTVLSQKIGQKSIKKLYFREAFI